MKEIKGIHEKGWRDHVKIILKTKQTEGKEVNSMVSAENIKEGKTVEAHRGTSSSISEFIGTKVS